MPSLSSWLDRALRCAAAAVVVALSGCGGSDETTQVSGDVPAGTASADATSPSKANGLSTNGHAEQPTPSAEPRTRRFVFHYGATVSELPVGATVRVWLPVPQSNEHQEVEPVGEAPFAGSVDTEPRYGNRILHFETAAPESGELGFDVAYRVTRREVRALDHAASQAAREQLSDLERQMFLHANAMVPVEGKPLDLLQGIILPDEPMDLARQLYRTVDDHMRYDKSGTGWGQGDSVWACASGYGNCTDFHSLFISLARANKLPARFVIGFPLPPRGEDGTVAGYHCWAYCYVDDIGWVPVDISEADKNPDMKDYYFGNLTEDRVAFTSGRDLDLVPRQQGPALNFFVYPYVEVDGKPVGKEQFALRMRCEDE